MTPAWLGLFYDLVAYDTIIRSGRWFDGTGAPSAVRDIDIREHVVSGADEHKTWTNAGEYVRALEALQQMELASVS